MDQQLGGRIDIIAGSSDFGNGNGIDCFFNLIKMQVPSCPAESSGEWDTHLKANSPHNLWQSKRSIKNAKKGQIQQRIRTRIRKKQHQKKRSCSAGSASISDQSSTRLSKRTEEQQKKASEKYRKNQRRKLQSSAPDDGIPCYLCWNALGDSYSLNKVCRTFLNNFRVNG